MAAQTAERVYNFERFSPRVAAAPVTEEKKPTNIVELPQQMLRKSRSQRVRPLRAVARIFCVLTICAVLGGIVVGQVQLTELNEQLGISSARLAEAESIELQLQYTADQGMGTAEIEDYAMTELGMQKINPAQVTYIELADGNGGTVVREINSKPWFMEIWDTVMELLS